MSNERRQPAAPSLSCYQGDTKVAQDSGDDNIVIKTLYSNGLTENNALTPGKALC